MQAFQKKDAKPASQETGAAPEPADQKPGATSPANELPEEAAKPAKKRYYSPNEVMKKKGCIGCGGMALAILLLAAGIAAVLMIL